MYSIGLNWKHNTIDLSNLQLRDWLTGVPSDIVFSIAYIFTFKLKQLKYVWLKYNCTVIKLPSWFPPYSDYF
jgi:hypothetical protein